MYDRCLPLMRIFAILIVDDFATISRIIQLLLERRGFTDIEHVKDGPSALERLKSKRFGLVIADWHMAPMSGLELLQRMRQGADLKSVRFLLVTADGSFQDSAAMRSLDVDGFLMKPFSAETLTKTIEQVLATGQKS